MNKPYKFINEIIVEFVEDKDLATRLKIAEVEEAEAKAKKAKYEAELAKANYLKDAYKKYLDYLFYNEF